MRLPHAFYKFPFRFDPTRLAQEVGAIPEDAWRKHPQDYTGNAGLPLVASRGNMDNDGFEPPMQPTEWLERSPYIRQIFSQFRTLIGRARLMRLEPGSGVPPHVDIKHYWRMHTRVHIPVVTNPDEVRFICDNQSVHMAAGEAWTFDNWRWHQVVNGPNTRRIHLTFDTYGSAEFWNLACPLGSEGPLRFIPFENGKSPQLEYETFAGDPVLSPSELDLEFTLLIADVAGCNTNDPVAVRQLHERLIAIRNDWRVSWHHDGPNSDLRRFTRIFDRARDIVSTTPATLKVASNGVPAAEVLKSTVFAMLRPSILREYMGASGAAAGPGIVRATGPTFDRPVFIVAAPRSGSTLLFEMLARNEAFWTLGGEGHGEIESIPSLKPKNRGFDSNRLTEADATAEAARTVRANFLVNLQDAEGRRYATAAVQPQRTRFLEKTPKNALRIPFIKAIFPDAKFIFLHREPRANISSIVEAWRSGRFVTYRDLPDWKGLSWSLLLIPGWRELIGKELGEIATAQWRVTNETILQDLAGLARDDWCSVAYEEIVADRQAALRRLCSFADVPFSDRFQGLVSAPLPASRYTLTAPDPEKWRKNEPMFAALLPALSQTAEKLRALAP